MTRTPAQLMGAIQLISLAISHGWKPSRIVDLADGEYCAELTREDELVEVYWKAHPKTGFLRFSYGFRHHGGARGGDKYRTKKAVLELIRSKTWRELYDEIDGDTK